MVLESGHTFTQWSKLTEDEKAHNVALTNYAFNYCTKNPGVLLSYDEMNNAGLNHIYSFFIKEFNESSLGKIEYNDKGIVYKVGITNG